VSRAQEPDLKVPLSGKIYFVEGMRTDPESGQQIRTLPTLLVELRGEVNINLAGINSVPDNKQLTTTFAAIPDAPDQLRTGQAQRRKEGILVTDGHDDICCTPQKPFGRRGPRAAGGSTPQRR
jgi:hypothetical protein